MKKFLFLSLFLSTLVACSVDNEELQEDEFAALNVQADDCTVNAGEDNLGVYTNSYIRERIDDFGHVKVLYLQLLDEGVDTDGTFDPPLLQVFRDYNRSNLGDFTTTYTVGEGECTDSTDLTVTICDEIADAGSDNSISMTESELDAEVDDIGDIDAIYLSLLDEGVDTGGTLSPSTYELYLQYQDEGPGEYTTTYYLGEGNCGDTAELTLVITE